MSVDVFGVQHVESFLYVCLGRTYVFVLNSLDSTTAPVAKQLANVCYLFKVYLAFLNMTG